MASTFQFSGIGSGLDTVGLVNALIDQKRTARIAPKENQIATLQSRNDAFSQLKSLLLDLRSKSEGFRAINGGGLSFSAASSDESVLTATAGSNATSGTFDLTVSSLAANGKGSLSSSGQTHTSGNAAINSSINDGAAAADRTISVDVGTGANAETIDVEITSSTTLQGFVDSFNSQSSTATASLVNTGTSSSPSFQVLITSNESGLDEGQIAISVGSEIQTAGTGAFDTTTISQASNAEFSIDGIAGTISRSSNTISDVIPGLSFELRDVGSSKITVGPDPDATADELADFVDAFNEVVQFVNENDSIVLAEGDGELNTFGPLRGTSLDNNIVRSLRSALSSSGLGGQNVSIFAELGVTTSRDGTLSFDRDTFIEAVESNPNDVNNLLQNAGEILGKTGGTIDQFTRFNGLIDSSLNGNSRQINRLQTDIDRLEGALAQEEESLTRRFSRIDALIGEMAAQQNQLSGILAGLF